jgi:signal transduction histidine kinase
MTLTYVSVLAALAVLAVAGNYLSRVKLKIQQTSTDMLNRTTHQHSRLDRIALLADGLVTSKTPEQRARHRQELLSEVVQMERSHSALSGGDPQLGVPPAGRALHFDSLMSLDQKVRNYVAKVRALAMLPDAELSLDHPLFRYILVEAHGELSEAIDAVTFESQERAEAGIQRLRRIHTGVVVSTLTALLLMGLLVFRPMVRRVKHEHAALLQGEEAKRLAERQALIGTMATKFAHEVRNPLSSIKLNVELVRRQLEPLTKSNPSAGDETRALLRSMDSELRRIQRITQDYLKFGRIPKSAPESLALNDMLTQRLSFKQPLLQSQAVILRTELDPTLPPIRVDEEQLWQAILNLVLNAAEAMPQGGTLTVSTTREGTDAVLKIADTGQGMTEAERSKVFTPFFTTKQNGTGLGLPLAQQVVVENGGRIEFDSIPGKGTTFTLRFPRAPE